MTDVGLGKKIHCFVEKIEKSPHTIKHAIQQKSSAVALVSTSIEFNATVPLLVFCNCRSTKLAM